MITFRYKKVIRPDKSEVKSPSIPITIIGKLMRFDVVALLDSGADVSAIPKDIAELLGLDLDKKIESAYGIGGKVDSIQTTMNIILEKGHEHYSFNIPVKVILDSYEFPVLLGRAGFFDKFVISFDQKNEKVSLKKIGD
ncbi:MAG: hypothetical protein Q8L29_03425 [archaeon]|nr:hypothetical protein [archaeon]